MKKTIITLFTLFLLLGSAQFVFAQGFGLDKTAGAAGYETTGAAASLSTRIQLVVSVILGLVAVVFFGLILYGGITWMTARGKEEKVSEAKSILEAATIGLAVIGASYGIATFILNRLGTSETGCCSSESGSEMIFENIDKASCDQKQGNWTPSDC